nr:MAG TPA: hypothetical protein [Caudoviricetes sp.]DAH97362.1 MAG TPA: hypothetical protein [Bacteriophage sp.]
MIRRYLMRMLIHSKILSLTRPSGASAVPQNLCA